jgi:hypothetical protein
MTVYKVLKDGKSCHGGTHTWDLPQENDGTTTPGAWQELPESVELIVCESGFHVTTDPESWLLPFSQVYEAETDDENIIDDDLYRREGDKTIHRRVRLLRPAPEMIPVWMRDTEAFVTSLDDIPFLSATDPGIYPVYDPDRHLVIGANRERERRDTFQNLYWPRDNRHHFSIMETHMLIKTTIRRIFEERNLLTMYLDQVFFDAIRYWSWVVIPSLYLPIPDPLLATLRGRWEAWQDGQSVVGGTGDEVVVYEPPFSLVAPAFRQQTIV